MSDHPLVAAYLADLDRALIGTDPREREDTLEAIRDHLREALGDAPTSDDVRGVLADLGSVDAIAAGATPSAGAATVTVVPATDSPARLDRGALVALVASVVALLLLFWSPWAGLPLALVALVVAVQRTRRGGDRSGAAWTAVVVSAATLVLGVVLSLTLFASGAGSPAPGPVDDAPTSAS